MRLEWVLRKEPLQPQAVVATGDRVEALGRKLLGYEAERLGALNGVGGPGLLAVMGEADLLPWLPHLQYLGRDLDLPGFYLPTTHRPKLPQGFMASALNQAGIRPPTALLASPSIHFQLGAARPITHAYLERFLEAV